MNVTYLGFERDYEINNNQQYFQVTEIETFQIKFNQEIKYVLSIINPRNIILNYFLNMFGEE